MRFFPRWRAPEAYAAVGRGFWVAEAVVMQRVIGSLLPAVRPRGAAVPAHLEFGAGAEGRVVVEWRNRIVGFVPASHEEMLRRQLAVAGSVRLVADGEVREHGGVLRIWAGPPWPDGEAPPDEPVDEIPPEPATIFGIAIGGRKTPARTPATPAPPAGPAALAATPPARTPATPAPPAGSAAPAATPPTGADRPQPARRRWVLSVGTESWEVRDGTDVDLPLLRRRIADADPGARLHVRVWDATVTIDLTPSTRVTLTDPDTGHMEVLHPRPRP